MARCFGKLREKPFPRFCDGMRGAAGGHATACDSHLPSTTRANTAKKEEGLSRAQGRRKDFAALADGRHRFFRLTIDGAFFMQFMKEGDLSIKDFATPRTGTLVFCFTILLQ